MIRTLIIRLIALTVAVVLLAGCAREDEILPVVRDSKDYPATTTDATLTIRVKSEGRDLADVVVQNGDREVMTDSKGIVVIQLAQRTELGYSVSLRKHGYTPRTTIIPARQGSRHIRQELSMNAIAESEYRQSTSDAELVGDSTLTVALGQSRLVTAGGNMAESIVVGLEVASLTDVPGDQVLMSAEGEVISVMDPVFSFTVVARSEMGEPLSIASGEDINIDLNTSVLNTHNSFDYSSSQVYFQDPLSGFLLPASDVEINSERVSGQLSQLGTYYVGDMYEATYVSTQLISNNNIPMALAGVELQASRHSSIAYADEQGYLTTYLPSDGDLSIGIVGVDGNLELFDAPNTAGSIGEVLEVDAGTIALTGTFQDCDDLSNFSGYLLYHDQIVALVGSDGSVIGSILVEDYDASIPLSVMSTTTDVATSFTLPSDSDSIDIGVVTVCASGGIGGFRNIVNQVRYDQDDDGIGESVFQFPGILRSYVLLYSDNVKIDSASITGAQLSYRFDKLPIGREYEVEFILDDAVQVEDYYMFMNLPGNEIPRSVTNPGAFRWSVLVQEENELQYHIVGDNANGSIAGRVTSDLSGNGLGDLPYANTAVNLYLNTTGSINTAPLIKTSMTDLEGNYVFEGIPNRTYYITLPDLLDDSVESIAEGDESPNTAEQADEMLDGVINVFLKPGEADTDNNFTVRVTMTVDTPGSISGTVTQDTDDNGTGDLDIDGAEVQLYARDVDNNPTGPVLQSVVTIANGSYKIENVVPGQYMLFVDPYPLASFTNLVRVSDRDDTPEADEPTDSGPGDGYIIVNVQSDTEDTDNNAIVRID